MLTTALHIIHRINSCTYVTVIFFFISLKGYLRLGCMARDKGQIYEASDWFQMALQIDRVNNIFNYK